jgi:hypothetical protein
MVFGDMPNSCVILSKDHLPFEGDYDHLEQFAEVGGV